MNITSAQYIELSEPHSDSVYLTYIKATVDNIIMFVPIDTSNYHYAAIKAKHDDADDSFTIQDAD